MKQYTTHIDVESDGLYGRSQGRLRSSLVHYITHFIFWQYYIVLKLPQWCNKAIKVSD